MTKVFISQPMRGKSEDKIIKERDKAIKHAESLFGKDDFEVIDSYFKDYKVGVDNPLWTLGRSIQLLSQADAVIFCQGWDEAKGCAIEYMCARNYNKEVYIIGEK